MEHGGTSSEPHNNAIGQPGHDSAEREVAADERQTRPDAGETSLAAREVLSDARGASPRKRTTRTEGILADAHDRDDQADHRDVIADDRDRAASLQSFLHDEEYDPGNRARRAAALDRSDSKADRASAAADRSELADDDAGT